MGRSDARDVFDYLARMPTSMVRRYYKSFKEGRLLKDRMKGIPGDTF